MKIWKIVFIIWLILWFLFLVRGFVKKEFNEFKAISFASIDEKKAYLMGKGLYDFLKYCQENMPIESTYKITGELTKHNKARLVYYLYPRVHSEDPDYVLDINTPNSKYKLKQRR